MTCGKISKIMKKDNKDQIKEYLQIILELEYFGIHMEFVEEKDFTLLYYFSVPEKLKLDDENKTSEDLMTFAKETLTEMFINSCEMEFSDEEKEILEDIKNNISDYALFYAKVRRGEIWTEENAKAAIQKIMENNSYKQV